MRLPELRMTSATRTVFGLLGGVLMLIALALLATSLRSTQPDALPVGGAVSPTPTPSATALTPTALDPAVSAIQQGDVRSQTLSLIHI
jgi:hypothetical protein